MPQFPYELIRRAVGYVLSTTLLLLFVLSDGQLQAAVLVQLLPTPAQPQPVGTTITWKALATDTNPGTLA